MFFQPNHCPFPPEAIPGRVISIVGAGGKSTIVYYLASHHAARGKRVLVLTTTKIWRPDPGYFAATVREARDLWAAGRFAVIGTPLGQKLTFPDEALLGELYHEADLVLIEADGARHHPIKVPRPGEPVLLPQTDTVLCVMGLSALGQPVGEVCFGWPDPFDGTLLTGKIAAQLLTDGYPQADFYILNQWDRPELGVDIPEFLPGNPLFSRFSPAEREAYQQIARGSLHEF